MTSTSAHQAGDRLDDEAWLAERELEASGDGHSWTIRVRLGPPVPQETGGYRCRVVLDGEPFGFDGAFSGQDEFQALVLSLGFIASSLETMAEARDIVLTYNGDTDIGFRTPRWG
jgi:hypothetical protein